MQKYCIDKFTVVLLLPGQITQEESAWLNILRGGTEKIYMFYNISELTLQC